MRTDFGNAGGVTVGAAERLANDFVDQAEFAQSRRRDTHGLRRGLGLVRTLPQDARAAFRRNHAVDAVLEHDHPVADPDGQGTAGAALADHDADDWRLQARHLEEVPGDGLALAPLLGADARDRRRACR